MLYNIIVQRDLRARRAAHAGPADPCPPPDDYSGYMLRDNRQRGEAAAMLDHQSAWYSAPQPTSFLRPGTSFRGTQLVSQRQRSREDWNVVVSIEVRSVSCIGLYCLSSYVSPLKDLYCLLSYVSSVRIYTALHPKYQHCGS